MGKGRFVNQKLGKRTGYVQQQRKSKLEAIPASQKGRHVILDAKKHDVPIQSIKK